MFKRAIAFLSNTAHPSLARSGRLHRHTLALAIGIALMLLGTFIAHCAHACESLPAQLGIDALGYGLHGLGLVPIAAHAEAWFALLSAD